MDVSPIKITLYVYSIVNEDGLNQSDTILSDAIKML